MWWYNCDESSKVVFLDFSLEEHHIASHCIKSSHHIITSQSPSNGGVCSGCVRRGRGSVFSACRVSSLAGAGVVCSSRRRSQRRCLSSRLLAVLAALCLLRRLGAARAGCSSARAPARRPPLALAPRPPPPACSPRNPPRRGRKPGHPQKKKPVALVRCCVWLFCLCLCLCFVVLLVCCFVVLLFCCFVALFVFVFVLCCVLFVFVVLFYIFHV